MEYSCLIGVFVPFEISSFKWRQICTHIRHLWSFSIEGSFTVYPTYVTRNIRLQWSSPMTRYTQTYCRSLSNGAVTACMLKRLGMSRPNFENPTFRMRCERSNRMRHRRDYKVDSVKMQHNYVHMRLVYVNVQQNYVYLYMQLQ